MSWHCASTVQRILKGGNEKMFRKVVITVVLCLFVAASVSAQQRGTPAEAKKMVEDAIAYIKASGKDKAFAEISNPKGKFVDRDLYVYVCDMNGTCLARGDDPSSVGKNNINSKDPDGKFFIKERIEMAKAQGSGWQDYKFRDPISKKVMPKTFYFEKYEDFIVGCGAYKHEK
jgi:signal transduction histidine kinase